MNNPRRLSIITIGMNHLSYLKSLYQSLFIENKPVIEFEAIYVDNCSNDGSVDFLRNQFPNVRIIINSSPLGFGENNNKGVMASTGQYVAIINPDIILQKGSIDVLYNYLESHPEVGIVAPQLLNPDMTIQFSVRGYLSPKLTLYRFLTRGKDESDNKEIHNYLCKDLDFEQSQPIDWAIGAALMLSRDTYAQLGGFDQDYYLYIEDQDLCLRSWKMGRPVWYVPESKMIHNHLRSSTKIGKKTWMHFKSICIFLKKHSFNIPSFRMIYNDSQERQ